MPLFSFTFFTMAFSILAVYWSFRGYERSNKWQKRIVVFDAGMAVVWIAMFAILVVFLKQKAPAAGVSLYIVL